MRWETDPEEQDFVDLMDTRYAKASLHWPSSHAEPKWEVHVEAKASGHFSDQDDGQKQAEAVLRTIAEAVAKELGGRIVWEENRP